MNFKDDPVQQQYAKLALIYDQKWSYYNQQTVKAVIDRLTINPQDKILDLGCGTGNLLKELVKIIPEENLFGVDCCPEMLDIAQKKLPKTVHLSLNHAQTLNFPANSFEQIISTSNFHYFTEPSPVIQEAKRVLKPNGYFIITDWCRDFLTCKLLDMFLQSFDSAHFFTYNSQELKTIVKQENFQEIKVETYKLNWFWGMMTLTAVK